MWYMCERATADLLLVNTAGEETIYQTFYMTNH